MSLRGLVLLVALLAAAAGSWWLSRTTELGVPDGAGVQQDQPGYYLRDATILGTAEDGSLLYRVEADDIRQSPTEDSVRLQRVRVRYAQAGQAGWTVSAEEGRIKGQGESIDLSGNVELVNVDDRAERNLVIRTETLFFQPRERIARTADAVQISQKGYELKAVGMEADLNREFLRLESDVSGIFKP